MTRTGGCHPVTKEAADDEAEHGVVAGAGTTHGVAGIGAAG